MVSTDGLAIVPLGEAAIPDGLALVEEAAGIRSRRLARHDPHGHTIGCRDGDGRFIASGLAMPYGERIGWISMVLVAGAWRRRASPRGSSSIARNGWRHAASRRCWMRHPPGRRCTGRWIPRRHRHDALAPPARCRGDAATVRPVIGEDLPVVARMDAEVFGGTRRFLLEDLLSRSGAIAMAATGPRSASRCHQRQGSDADGPVIAQDGATAIDLVDRHARCDRGTGADRRFDRHDALIRHSG